MINALTVDVEDYFHVSAFDAVVRPKDWNRLESRVENNTYRVLDSLDEFGTKATFFVLGWVAERNPEVVREISRRGHEVASHGYSHQRIYRQDPDQFREETRISKKILEDITGQRVFGYRAASYSITPKSLWAIDILREEGFLYDSSIYPIRHDLYGISNHDRFAHFLKTGESGRIAECPLSTFRFGGINFPVGGGGYLRLYPYPLTQWAIQRINRIEKKPVIVYFHPWEIDPSQPRIQSGWKSRFRHYTNLKKMERKIKHLLKDFQFAPMKEVFGELINSDRN